MSFNLKSSNSELTEFTLRGFFLGSILTAIFTASNIYLGLKVGLTFSSSIPAAVISMAVLRSMHGSTILENNIVQTQASAAGTLSSIIFVLPGLVMIGTWQGFPFIHTMGLCAVGGMLGVMFTIPLRHVMVIESELPYPEGIAAAEILRLGSKVKNHNHSDLNNHGINDIATGSAISAIVTFASNGLRILSDSASIWFSIGTAIFRIPVGFSLALMGAGYLIGISGGVAMLIGVFIAWFIAVPWLTASNALYLSNISFIELAMDLWNREVRFIGAGVIGIASLWTLIILLKPVFNGVVKVLRTPSHLNSTRTDQDLPPTVIAVITTILFVLLTVIFITFVQRYVGSTETMWTLALCGVSFTFIFGFLISAACGYMAGLVGSSSSPISGIGILAVILISIFLLISGHSTGLLDRREGEKIATAFALFTTSAVLAVATISNDNLQDLKTGWLIGATPWRQQVALLLGCIVGAITIPPTLELLYHAYGFSGALPRSNMDPSQSLNAPQAVLMTSIAKGIFNYHLNWTMLGIGVLLGGFLITFDAFLRRFYACATLPVLAVGIGIYLPPTIATPLIIGSFISYRLSRILRKKTKAIHFSEVNEKEIFDNSNRRGVLFCSGLIVGESLMGIFLAAIIGFTGKDKPLALVSEKFSTTSQYLGFLIFCIIIWFFWRRITLKIRNPK